VIHIKKEKGGREIAKERDVKKNFVSLLLVTIFVVAI
jgi:hypothetical protein